MRSSVCKHSLGRLLRENVGPSGSRASPIFYRDHIPPPSPPQWCLFARLGWCRPEWPLCSLPGLEVVLCNYISVRGSWLPASPGSCLPLACPGKCHHQHKYFLLLVGPKRGRPCSDPHARHWSQGREGVGNKETGTMGHSRAL